MCTIVGNNPGSLGGCRLPAGVVGLADVVVLVGIDEDAFEEGGRNDAIEDDWTERRVRVISKGYVMTTEVIPARAPAVKRRGVVSSVAPLGINI